MGKLIIEEKEFRDLCFEVFQMGLNNAWNKNYSEVMERKIKELKQRRP